MLATIRSATLSGVWGHPVSVEVHVANGLPAFTVVGLPDTSCREARDRVRAAILSSGLDWPMRRITVNLAPSNVPKAGAGLDLAIALGTAGRLRPARRGVGRRAWERSANSVSMARSGPCPARCLWWTPSTRPQWW